MYRVILDREACDGVFACLVRDDRFVEADDGLVTVSDAATLEHDDDTLVATFESGRDAAEGAAAACPVDAITVEDDGGEVP